MAFKLSLHFFEASVASAVFYIVYYIYWQLTIGASRRALINKHGCKPIRSVAEINSFPENIFGTRVLRWNVQAIKDHKIIEIVRARYDRIGNTFQGKVFFTPMIFTIEVDNIKTMLALNFKEWNLSTRRKLSVVPLLGHGIFTTDGTQWQHSRELLRPNFVRSQVGDMETFETHIDQLINSIPRDGSTVDLQDLFFQMTMDSATEFLFGESTGCLAPGEKNPANMRFTDAFNSCQVECIRAYRVGLTSRIFRPKKFADDVDFINTFVDKYVRQGLDYRRILDSEKGDPRAKDRYVFLYELVKQTTDPLRIRSELLNILLAGRDTTASLLAGVFFVLARRPDVWSKLRAEVGTLGGQKPSFEQIKDLKYLRMVLNETLRLYTVVPFNAREAVVDAVLPLGGGEDGKSPLFVPKGTIVNYTIAALHRRKDLYGEDADEFKPERWEKIRPGWVGDTTVNSSLL